MECAKARNDLAEVARLLNSGESCTDVVEGGVAILQLPTSSHSKC